jgi:uncharacterized membrane protein
VGTQRTAEQDVEFAVDQLVEVAVRAMSPAINDPFTAIACLDWLRAGLCRAARGRTPHPYRAVMLRMLEAIEAVVRCTGGERDEVATLLRHAQMATAQPSTRRWTPATAPTWTAAFARSRAPAAHPSPLGAGGVSPPVPTP